MNDRRGRPAPPRGDRTGPNDPRTRPQGPRPQGPQPPPQRRPERAQAPAAQAPARVQEPPKETPPEPPRRVHLPLTAVQPTEDTDGIPDFAPFEGPDDAWLYAVVMVRVGDAQKPLRCDASGLTLRKGDAVVVETDRGIELGMVSAPPRRMLLRDRPMARCLRRASEGDLRGESSARLREAEAARVAAEVVRAMDLPVKVVRAEVAMSGGRTVIFLASEERVELRDLARRLGTAIQGRVELRHVGVRDAARAIGGVGPCGLQLCCNTFLSEFAPVSIRHAKEQGLALTPQRVSGVCGRLMCCLVYEDAFYRQQRGLFPKQGKRVMTPKGEGRVRDVDVLARVVRVVFPDDHVESFDVEALRPASVPGEGSPAT